MGPKSQSPGLYVFDWRWSRPADMDRETFREMVSYMVELCKMLFTNWIFQWEATVRADGTMNDHFQGYAKTKARRRDTALGKAMCDLLNEHVIADFAARGDTVTREQLALGGFHVGNCSNAGKEHLKAYSMKPATRVEGPWMDKDSLEEKPVDSPYIKEKGLRPWQQSVIEKLEEDPDDRKVIIIYDRKGCAGKDQLGKHLKFKYGAEHVPTADFKHLMHCLAKSKFFKIYAINLTRADPTDHRWKEVPTMVEQLKNGHYLDPMYDSRIMHRPPAHVVVFTNSVFPTWTLSEDRIKDTYYSVDTDFNLVPCTLGQLEYDRRTISLEMWARKALRKREDAANKACLENMKLGKVNKDDPQFDEVVGPMLSKPLPKRYGPAGVDVKSSFSESQKRTYNDMVSALEAESDEINLISYEATMHVMKKRRLLGL